MSSNIENLSQQIQQQYQNYIFKKLDPSFLKDSSELIARQFHEESPLNVAYRNLYPENGEMQLQQQLLFWPVFAQEFCSNGLSVGCFVKNTNELIGVAIAKDFTFVPSNFKNEQSSTQIAFINIVEAVEQQLVNNCSKQHQQVLKLNKIVVDIFGLAIKKNHTGKKFLQKMIIFNQKLASLQQFQYCFIYSTNLAVSKTAGKLGYQKISEIDCTKFSLNGINYLQKIDQKHKYSRLWLKKLNVVKEQ